VLPDGLRSKLLSWLYFAIVVVMFLPVIMDWDYPQPFRRYVQSVGLGVLCGLFVYQRTLSNRLSSERAREDRAEYRRLMKDPGGPDSK
jgi:hypothetical protein